MHVGELIVGRYELEELVGEGGMSTVYRAYDTVLERRVAIKILHEHFSRDPEYVERFRREARAIARLAHPNVVTVIDRGEWEGRQFIVFEHVAGENVKAVIVREGPLPVDRALSLACQIARALAFAHELGIVHRDVKPHNVLLDGTGTAKVTDFGIARALDADDGLTATGTVLGTGQYLSPEQANGERGDERSDQYSLGVVTFELLTGEVPYSGDNLMALALRHVKDPVPSVRRLRPEVPECVDAVVARAMAKRPEDRFGSMETLAGALESCLAEALEKQARGREEDTGVLAASPPPPAPPAPRRAPARPSRPEPAHAQPTRPRRSGLRIAGVLLLAAVVLVGNLLVLEILFEDGLPGLPGLGGGDPVPVQIEAVSDLDPFGDNQAEHPEAVPAATDGDPATFWTTEEYRSFAKEGVGIVVDAGSRVELSRVVLLTDTPGFTALIAASNDAGADFVDVAGSREVGRRTTFEIDTRGESYRYYVVWITDLEGVAHVNEVRGFVSA
ncbi:MAG TPA: protein kinase [Gaiellaceae bacterium]|nr:protein kinase [Gaiellaceae bacterium]